MATLANIRSNVAAKLVRSDLSSQIDKQIGAAVRFYRRKPWEFTEMRVGEISTVASQAEYDAVDFTGGVGAQASRTTVSMDDIIDIETIRQPDAGGYVLTRIPYREFEKWREGASGATASYWTRYADRLLFYPIPSGVQALEVSATVKPIVPVASGDNSVFFDRCPEMIEEYAAEKVCEEYLRNPGKAAVHRAARFEQERVMNSETRRRTATGRITPYY